MPICLQGNFLDIRVSGCMCVVMMEMGNVSGLGDVIMELRLECMGGGCRYVDVCCCGC